MKVLEYTKEYTRDTSLIMQELWNSSLSKGALKLLGKKNPYFPTVIHYMKDGVIEVWESEKSRNWYIDELLKKNKKKGFFIKIKKKTDLLTKKLGKYWKNKKLSSIKELQKFVKLLFESINYFTIFYYTAVDERTPKDIRKKALKMREKDSFFDDSDKVIRNTLIKFYPKIKGWETTVLHNELKKIPSIKILKERKKNCVLIGGKRLYTKTIEKFLKENRQYKFLIEKIDKKIIKKGIVKGKVAYKGVVKGKVRLLMRKEQVKEVKKGDVIVTSMTVPDFITGMKKAVAFVTDEGGITCHAAIIAREMKKPCVIGTKFATRIFENGDLVEVDARKGIIKILKKKRK